MGIIIGVWITFGMKFFHYIWIGNKKAALLGSVLNMVFDLSRFVLLKKRNFALRISVISSLLKIALLLKITSFHKECHNFLLNSGM